MKRAFTYISMALIFGVAAFGLCLADEIDVAELVKNHPVQADYPNDESVILYESVHYSLDEAGKITKRAYRVRTMFTENAMDHYGDPHIGYFHDCQDLNIEICRGYMLDGRTVDTQPNGFNLITPFALCLAPDYTGFQQMVITHTGLEWGGSSELLYTIKDKEKNLAWMEGVEYFQSDEHILLKEVKVTVPENVDLHFKFLNGDGDMKMSVKDGMRTRVWTMKDAPHIMHDDAYRYRLRFAPTLIFSTCPDWKAAGSFLAETVSESAEETELLQAEAEEVIKERSESYFIIDELTKMVRNRVGTISYHSDIFPWHHRKAERTLSTAYGNAFDKAILLAALLKSQGLPAELAVSADIYPSTFSVPMITIFDNFWVITEKNGEEIFLDPLNPLSSHSRKDIAGHAVFRFNYRGEEPRIEPWFSIDDNKLILNMKVEVGEDGAYTGSGYFRASGYFSPFYSAAENSEGVTGWLKGEFGGLLPNLEVSGGSARELSIKDCKFTFDFCGDDLGETKDGYLILEIPEPPISLDLLEPSRFHPFYTKRGNPIYFKGLGRQLLNITFELPKGWSVSGMPDNVQKESSIGSGIIECKSDGNKFELFIQRSIKEQTVSAGDFPILRNIYLLWEKRSNKFIIFKTE
ncbi:MAG: DUF3857 domain-containing protein [candidate division Zixibacteria bacterium]|nr:DUF3857 domain-containing protein [Candidatus Tariuqbacter arcticus]